MTDADPKLDRVKDTIRKLLNLAANDAATEGEVNNAVRFARKLMLQHQLSEDDCTETETTEEERIARAVCQDFASHSQSTKATSWESCLSMFVCQFVGGVKVYKTTNAVRREHGIIKHVNGSAACAIWTFYGLAEDAAVAQRVFDDLAITIASMGRLKWGGAFRGPGREYCEGFVDGLFSQLKQADAEQHQSESRALTVRRDALIHAKAHRADQWLRTERGVKLRAGRGYGATSHHADAHNDGHADGAKTSITGRQAKLGHDRPSLPR